MAHVFVYGSLTNQSVVQAVTGHTFRSVRATLPGFRRYEEPGRYPYILPADGKFVAGLLLLGVDPESLQRLDAYEEEGEFYHRVQVRVLGGRRQRAFRAWTYVGSVGKRPPQREPLASPR